MNEHFILQIAQLKFNNDKFNYLKELLFLCLWWPIFHANNNVKYLQLIPEQRKHRPENHSNTLN